MQVLSSTQALFSCFWCLPRGKLKHRCQPVLDSDGDGGSLALDLDVESDAALNMYNRACGISPPYKRNSIDMNPPPEPEQKVVVAPLDYCEFKLKYVASGSPAALSPAAGLPLMLGLALTAWLLATL